MIAHRFFPALLLSSLSFAIALDAQAFCLTHTCDPRKEQCAFDAGCNVGGKPLYWASSTVTWDVQKDGSPKEKISAAALEEIVDSAFKRWEAVDCGDGQGPNITLYNKGPISCGEPQYNSNRPNANVITFHDDSWPYSDDGAQTNTLALTTISFNPNTGEIYDADVEINSAQQIFVLKDTGHGGDDLNAVLTHELGHFLGLAHSSDNNATMFSSYDPGMITLEADDAAGLCASRGLPHAEKDTLEPRHGFSGECCVSDCDQTQSGCSSSALAGHTPKAQALGAWAFALGLFGWFGRARLRRRSRSERALPR